MITKPDCIFCRIARGEIPANKVHEDDEIVAFHDIAPKAPVHLLVIPKTHIDNLYHAGPEHQPLLGRMLKHLGTLTQVLHVTPHPGLAQLSDGPVNL